MEGNDGVVVVASCFLLSGMHSTSSALVPPVFDHGFKPGINRILCSRPKERFRLDNPHRNMRPVHQTAFHCLL